LAVRQAFQTAVAAGYVGTYFQKGKEDPDAGFYVLEPASVSLDPAPMVISGPDNRDALRRA
jgi:hypothetical protein